ncbi:MAG: hypothetical protein ABIH77_03710 [Pseudomonadota bacterium]|nr:hypothetical protein [Gammaproteobacteria bacterium]MBU1629042.1 hypothetical protein [Gammaproteobacteria bacterium]MBU1926832.1 hypothetical protein [Gammaproteobacteria bacterium]MBU2546188.1 hypothetical protein [Gammaproteobacteria bacterium]
MQIPYKEQQKKLVQQAEHALQTNHYHSTVIAMQKDYEKDKQRCLTSVVFIPNQIAQKIIKEVVDELKKIESCHYFYPPESMHITIKNIRTLQNLPSFTEQDIKKANRLFNEIVPQYSAFDFHLEDLIAFPTSLSVMAYSSDQLQKLILALDKGLKEIGIPDNKRYFSDEIFWGNISFCRFMKKPAQQFIDRVKQMRHLKIGTFRAEKVHLISCNAGCAKKTIKVHGEYYLK